MVRALIVVDPEVKIDEPVDFSNAPPYISRALAHGKPGWSVTRSNIDQMNAIMKIMDEDLRAARSVSASASPIWP